MIITASLFPILIESIILNPSFRWAVTDLLFSISTTVKQNGYMDEYLFLKSVYIFLTMPWARWVTAPQSCATIIKSSLESSFEL